MEGFNRAEKPYDRPNKQRGRRESGESTHERERGMFSTSCWPPEFNDIFSRFFQIILRRSGVPSGTQTGSDPVRPTEPPASFVISEELFLEDLAPPTNPAERSYRAHPRAVR